jgi:hypothetical protein
VTRGRCDSAANGRGCCSLVGQQVATHQEPIRQTVDGLPAEPIEGMIALGFGPRGQAIDRGTVRTRLSMFMTGPESEHVAKTDPPASALRLPTPADRPAVRALSA